MLAVPQDLLELAEIPPIFSLSATANIIGYDDDHRNPVWRGFVSLPNPNSTGIAMAIKYLGVSSIKTSIELACGLVAFALKLPVPRPALVYCEREDLPELPNEVIGQTILLFGSQFQYADNFWTQSVAKSASAADQIWNKICSLPLGSRGAAWDELIANPDRNHNNLIFDGSKWWLFDHDKAIQSDTATKSDANRISMTRDFTEFVVKTNLLAIEMIKRRPNDHNLEIQSKDFDKHKQRLQALSHLTSKWTDADPRINGILVDTNLFINMISNRLPALANHLIQRIGARNGDSLWTSQEQP